MRNIERGMMFKSEFENVRWNFLKKAYQLNKSNELEENQAQYLDCLETR